MTCMVAKDLKMALTIPESVVKFIFKMGKTQTELSKVKKKLVFF